MSGVSGVAFEGELPNGFIFQLWYDWHSRPKHEYLVIFHVLDYDGEPYEEFGNKRFEGNMSEVELAEKFNAEEVYKKYAEKYKDNDKWKKMRIKTMLKD